MIFHHDTDVRLRITNVFLNTVTLVPVGGSRVESISGILKFEVIYKSWRLKHNSRRSPITGVYVVLSVF